MGASASCVSAPLHLHTQSEFQRLISNRGRANKLHHNSDDDNNSDNDNDSSNNQTVQQHDQTNPDSSVLTLTELLAIEAPRHLDTEHTLPTSAILIKPHSFLKREKENNDSSGLVWRREEEAGGGAVGPGGYESHKLKPSVLASLWMIDRGTKGCFSQSDVLQYFRVCELASDTQSAGPFHFPWERVASYACLVMADRTSHPAFRRQEDLFASWLLHLLVKDVNINAAVLSNATTPTPTPTPSTPPLSTPGSATSSPQLTPAHLHILYEILDVPALYDLGESPAIFSRRFMQVSNVSPDAPPVVVYEKVRDFVARYAATHVTLLRSMFLPRDFAPASGDLIRNVI